MKKYVSILLIGILAGAGGIYYYLHLNKADAQNKEAESHVYETDAESVDDCASFEEYDAEKKVCSFECTDEKQCSDMQKQADAEFENWTDELQKDKTPVAEKKISPDTESAASYIVEPTEKISLKSGEDNPEYLDIWNSIKDLSPDDLSDKYIETYEVYTDQNDDTLAFVDDDDGNGKWRISINVAGYKTSTERENKTTIIHELGHIISLNNSQVNPNIESCDNLKLDEGCANKDSAINTFWNTYWKGVTNSEFDENKYVTEYASTNETEDFAETFAFFVLEKDTELESDVKDRKIKLLYSFPDLVAIRTEMRNALSKDIIRARKKVTAD
jgi:Zn-dependent peptidase ImmA (M78 family)